VAYFAAQITGKNRQMGLFAAWSNHLFSGDWSSKLLYRGGGVIDPSIARVGADLMIVYCKQPSQIWESQLAPDGLNMLPDEHEISHATLSWEQGVEEGPILWPRDGHTFILYNAASTWDNSYKVALLEQTASGSWWKDPEPVLQSGSRLVSVGAGAQPFGTPHGLELAFHVQFNPASHSMEGRYLSFLPLVFNDGLPTIPGDVAHIERGR
jgi:hypothetical protein